MAAKEVPSIEQESQAGLAGLVGENLGIGQARVVIDGQVQVFPALAALLARARVALARAVPSDAVADAQGAAEFLDVDMDHFAWGFLFVADNLWLGVQGRQVAQSAGFSNPGHGGARQADLGRNLPERLADAAQDLHLGPLISGRAGLQLARPAGAVGKPRRPFGGITGEPFVHAYG